MKNEHIVNILKESPFYGYLLNKMQPVVSNNQENVVEITTVDGEARISINPKAFEKLDTQSQVKEIEKAVATINFGDRELWNAIADAKIEKLLLDEEKNK